ncbi:MAG: hypothetical protein ACOYNY_04545 [Caldilineaceae bacterium]
MNLHTHGSNFTLDQTSSYRPPMAIEPTSIVYSEAAQVTTVEQYSGATVSVVIPAMNEAANLPHVLPQIPDWVHERRSPTILAPCSVAPILPKAPALFRAATRTIRLLSATVATWG